MAGARHDPPGEQLCTAVSIRNTQGTIENENCTRNDISVLSFLPLTLSYSVRRGPDFTFPSLKKQVFVVVACHFQTVPRVTWAPPRTVSVTRRTRRTSVTTPRLALTTPSPPRKPVNRAVLLVQTASSGRGVGVPPLAPATSRPRGRTRLPTLRVMSPGPSTAT